MAYKDEPKYFAVPDPDTGDMTYWFRDRSGHLKVWPSKLRHDSYGPKYPSLIDVPREEQRDRVISWLETVRKPWMDQIHAAIESDHDAASARFAALSSRCCVCGKALTDAASKVYGIGPDCRDGLPPRILEAMALAMGRAHGHPES